MPTGQVIEYLCLPAPLIGTLWCVSHSLDECRTDRKDCLILSAALMPEGRFIRTLPFPDVHYGQKSGGCRLTTRALPMAYSRTYHKHSDCATALGAMKRGLKTIGCACLQVTAKFLRADIAAVGVLPVEGVWSREGVYVMPCRRLCRICNPVDTTITLLKALRGNERASVECSVLPGEEKTIKLPFEAEALRAFSGEKEVCIYLSS